MKSLQELESNEANVYQSENNLLKELFLERLKREGSKNSQAVQVQKKQILIDNKNIIKSQSIYNLFLNTLLYDKRKQKPSHYINFNAFFNQNPKIVNIGFDRKKSIRSIFMSTFGFQEELLQPIAEIGCNFIVANDKGSPDLKNIQQYAGYKNWTVIFPDKKQKGYGVFHTKLWLIKFDNFLRVVIGTGNLHQGDWAIWANAFWYQDFKKKINKIETPIQKTEKQKQSFDYNSDFKQTLKLVLKEMIPKNFKQEKLQIDLEDYIYENINIILIPSLPGKIPKQQIHKFGLGKIKQILKKSNQQKNITNANKIITCNTTSLGVLDNKFLADVYNAFNPNNNFVNWLQKIKIIYPTQKYIYEKTMGAAETLFLVRANYEKYPEGKNLFHRFEPGEFNNCQGVIPHLKVIIAQNADNKDEMVTFYIGSHNLTRAAWGKYQKNNEQLSFSNSQLGILFPQFNRKQLENWLPFKYPPEKYTKNELPFFKQM